MTVVWSLPPNCWPILGSDMSVSSRHRYMAMCRAVTRTRDRLPPPQGPNEHPGPARAAQVLDRQPEVRGGLAHDGRGVDLRALGLGDEVLEHDLGQLQFDAMPVEAP